MQEYPGSLRYMFKGDNNMAVSNYVPISNNGNTSGAATKFTLAPEIKGKEIREALNKENVSDSRPLGDMIGKYAVQGLKVSLSQWEHDISGVKVDGWKVTATDINGNSYTASDMSTYLFDDTMSKMLDSIMSERASGNMSTYNTKYEKPKATNIIASEPASAPQAEDAVLDNIQAAVTPLEARVLQAQRNTLNIAQNE